jgi:hypothetical protein
MLQDLAVAAIVLAAVAFLARKFFGRPKPKKAGTFIPIGNLKKKPDDQCH